MKCRKSVDIRLLTPSQKVNQQPICQKVWPTDQCKTKKIQIYDHGEQQPTSCTLEIMNGTKPQLETKILSSNSFQLKCYQEMILSCLFTILQVARCLYQNYVKMVVEFATRFLASTKLEEVMFSKMYKPCKTTSIKRSFCFCKFKFRFETNISCLYR